jgi:AAA domain
MTPADAWTVADPTVCSECGRDACEDHLASVVSAGAGPRGNVVPAETKLCFHTARELARRAPEQTAWTVPGFTGPGIVSEFDGKLKTSGKTTFLGHMSAAIVTGGSFLGRRTQRTGVVWLTEERPQTFVETLKRAGLADCADVHVLHWHDTRGVKWPAVVSQSTDYAIAHGAGVLIADTISQWAGLRGDTENNNGDQMTAIEPLQLAAARGLAVVVARHERKGGGDVGESGRGGSAFSGAVDIVVSLRRAEGKTKPSVRVLHTLSRFTETPNNLVIDLTPDGYVVLGTEGAVAVLEAERVLLDRLPVSAETALPLDDLREGEDRLPRTATQEALKKLTEAGIAKRVGSGKKGNAYRYFRTVNDSAGTQITRSGSI